MNTEQNYRISYLATLISSRMRLLKETGVIKFLSTDSRTITLAEETLFFALVAHQDGHLYLADAYQKGVRNFVISKEIDLSLFPEANVIWVNNTLTALQTIAAKHRQQFDIPIIGITGSNGKTIVKEWLFQLLSPDFNIVRSPKSYNSQIGVPLSLWQIEPWHQLGIFEIGVSKKGEMQKLADLVRPTIGILTNIGDAHNEGFESKFAKLTEKLKLFKDVNILVYGADNSLLQSAEMPNCKKLTWGYAERAHLQVIKTTTLSNSTEIELKHEQENFTIEVPFVDAAAIENVLTCCATMLALACSTHQIKQRIASLNKIEMRLQLIQGIDQCSLIDDSYSADYSSLSIALDFLNQQNQYPKRSLILSDFFETGKADELFYQELAKLINQKKVDKLIAVGENLSKYKRFFSLEAYFFESTELLLEALPKLHLHQETILIKGARKFGFERIVKRLTQKTHDTVLEINLNAMLANYQFYRSKIAKSVKVMAMVKAFSYGSGSFEIANLLQYHQIDYLAVAYADEGVALRKAGILLPIMVMSPEPSAFETMMRYQLEPEVYSLSLLNSLVDHLSMYPQSEVKIHIKLDTGMHRLGFEKTEIHQLKEILNQHSFFHVASVFTHLVASDDAQHDDFTRQQFELFEAMYHELVADFSCKPLRHVLNTSGISRWPEKQFDMVRLGIGLYGFDSVAEIRSHLQPVASLKTTISQIKHLKAGETVGYGRNGLISQDSDIATVKIGYADGYSRGFGNGIGKMLVNGEFAPTVGSICMDMCMINISGIEAKVGDEVIVFNEQLTIDDLAQSIGTIAYEILTNVSQRVKRVYYYE